MVTLSRTEEPPPAKAGASSAISDLALQALLKSESRYRRLFETARDGILLLNADTAQIEDVNPYLIEMLGYSHTQFLGKKLWEVGPFADIAQSKEMFVELQKKGYVRYENLPLRTITGDQVAVEFVSNTYDSGGIKVVQCNIRNITERKKAEERIQELAFFDQLTGLPNRTLLLDRLKQAMAVSFRNSSFGALLFLDLDNFKTLNDTLGHDMGDRLLKQVAQRLTQCVREGDTVARLGGDEFVVVLAGLSAAEEDAARGIETVSEKILVTLRQPYLLGNVTYHSTASIGVTLFKGDIVALDELMKQADLAMYKAKAAGRNLVRCFDPTLESVLNDRAALGDDLRHAIAEKQFLLHYQAQVVDDDRITGAEALVRWRHPQRGMISPAEFIPLAEDTGLILPLGHWILEAACSQLALWATQPEMANLMVAVNVSAHQFRQRYFVDEVLAVLENTRANPQRLRLELFNSFLTENVKDTAEKISALKAEGVSFSLDVFGTGYSYLFFLNRLPLDQLKIHKSFIRNILTDPNAAAIVKTIIALAKSLALDVIAEGVETEAQRNFLNHLGCPAYQGYFSSQPLPVDGFEQLARQAYTAPDSAGTAFG